VRVGTVPTLYYTKGEALPSKHEGATLRKIGAKQYYVDSKNTKNSKEPSSKREPRVLNFHVFLQH
jgi:hypothetical protein